MQDDGVVGVSISEEGQGTAEGVAKVDQVVSTHVLVPQYQADSLRELSRRTRIAQSEYLREAVEDLLKKYGCAKHDGAVESA